MYINGINGYLSKFEGIEVDNAVERVQGLDAEFALKVDKTTTVNGQSLANDVVITAADVEALPSSTKYAKSLAWIDNILYLKDQDGRALSSEYIEIDLGRWGHIIGDIEDQEDLQDALDQKVPITRTINDKPLSEDITLDASDVGALPEDTRYGAQLDFTNQVLTLQDANGEELDSVLIDVGVKNLVDLLDVDVENPTDGQSLTYNSEEQKWVNSTVNSAVWGNISGDIANQTDLYNELQDRATVDSLNTETTNRENADAGLQDQIDALSVASDVSDVVGTYQELQDYDTSTLQPNNIIKVLQDETRNNQVSYYRWVLSSGFGEWIYVGGEGPYYTKGQADQTFVPQTRTVNDKPLSANIVLDFEDVGALSDSTKYGASLSYSDANNELQLLDQDGNNLGVAKVVPSIDGITITRNTNNKLQTSAIIDNNEGPAKDIWTGTFLEYQSLENIDPNRFYNITDDEDAEPFVLIKRNIGQIVTSTVPLMDAGLHLLDGALISGSGAYRRFVSYIANLYGDGTNVPEYFCTEEEWQQTEETYGACGKFVYDSENNTVRLPKIVGFVEGAGSISTLGDVVEAGLPYSWLDHTHTRGTMEITGGFNQEDNRCTANGAFHLDYAGLRGGVGNDGSTDGYISFAASRTWTGSTSIPNYSNMGHDTTTVQPQSVKVLYYICVANEVKTDIEVDIDEVMTDLNSKADVDLTNCSDVGSTKMAHSAMPSATYVDFTVGISDAQYTAPSDGWVQIRGATTVANGYIYTSTVSGPTDYYDICYSAATNYTLAVNRPVKKGDVFTVGYGGATCSLIRFYYAEGSKSEAN